MRRHPELHRHVHIAHQGRELLVGRRIVHRDKPLRREALTAALPGHRPAGDRERHRPVTADEGDRLCQGLELLGVSPRPEGAHMKRCIRGPRRPSLGKVGHDRQHRHVDRPVAPRDAGEGGANKASAGIRVDDQPVEAGCLGQEPQALPDLGNRGERPHDPRFVRCAPAGGQIVEMAPQKKAEQHREVDLVQVGQPSLATAQPGLHDRPEGLGMVRGVSEHENRRAVVAPFEDRLEHLHRQDPVAGEQ